MLYQTEAEALKKSHWPNCERLADALAQRGPAASEALLFASTSRTHHVRSACLKALNRISPEQARALAEKFLEDKAYEVRETAASILGVAKPN